MPHESFSIEIDGVEMSDLYDNLQSLEVEQPEDLPATFRLEVGLPAEPDGTWSHLENEALRAWSPVTLEGGFHETGREELIRGYVTEVEVHFDADISQCVLTVSGIDASVHMDRDEQLKVWPNQKDSDIAAEIFRLHGFEPQVENTGLVHDEAVTTIVQRETDLHFLQRLARRNGFVCWVEEGRGHFAPVPGEATSGEAAPQPVLSVHFGGETTLRSFRAGLDALRPVNVAMRQVDRLSKEVLETAAESTGEKRLGERDASRLLPRGMKAAQVHLARNAASGQPEMETLCQVLYDEADDFVSAEGEVDGAVYGHVLRPRATVPVKGVGETWSGLYHVTSVRHTFTPDGYSQHFRARRNALRPSGTEDFSKSANELV